MVLGYGWVIGVVSIGIGVVLWEIFIVLVSLILVRIVGGGVGCSDLVICGVMVVMWCVVLLCVLVFIFDGVDVGVVMDLLLVGWDRL